MNKSLGVLQFSKIIVTGKKIKSTKQQLCSESHKTDAKSPKTAPKNRSKIEKNLPRTHPRRSREGTPYAFDKKYVDKKSRPWILNFLSAKFEKIKNRSHFSRKLPKSVSRRAPELSWGERRSAKTSRWGCRGPEGPRSAIRAPNGPPKLPEIY